jgi:hypothetical protein
MAGAENKYATLVASLPYQASLLAAKQTPISRINLDQRLRMLDADDAEQLRLVEGLLEWHRLSGDESEADLQQRTSKTVRKLEGPFLRTIVRDRLELRTVVAAMRRRRLGRDAPGPGEAWGYGRWLGQIRKNWSDPAFRLDNVFPWAVEASRLMQSGDWVGVERLLLSQTWQMVGRAGWGHYFDFEAVVVYVLRWSAIDRWTRYDAVGAAERFAKLVDEGMEKPLELGSVGS